MAILAGDHPSELGTPLSLEKNWPIISHNLETRSSDENSVCLSVCLSVRLSVLPSVKRVDCDKTEEKSVQILYHAKYHLV